MSSLKKKYAVGIFLFALVVLFIGFQFLFLKNIFGIDPFARDILPKGFCKDCNVILISLDTLRAKDLPCYGYGKNTSPNLCTFAKKSFLFTNTYSTASKTLDSHFSIFTSLYPSSHNMNIPFVSVLSKEILTLPQILKSLGYETFYIGTTASPHLPLKKGLERGFDKIIDNGGNPDGWIKNISDNINPQSNKFFAFLHTAEAHEPYIPQKENIAKFYNGTAKAYISWKEFNNIIKEKGETINEELCKKYVESQNFGKCYESEYDKQYQSRMQIYWDTFKDIEINEKKKYIQSLYDAKIYELDQKLGKLLNYLEETKLLAKTIVVITSDHGEEFYEHNGWTHGYTLYNEVIHVPLIVYIPRTKSEVIDKLSSSIDIYPSILGILGAKSPNYINGINLFSRSEHDYVMAQHVSSKLYAILNKDWKLIVNNKAPVTKELYNQKKDYDEKNNLVNQQKDMASSLEYNLQKEINSIPKFSQENNKPFPTWIDEDQRKKLIETGYF